MKRIDNSQKVNLPDLKFTPQLDMEMKPYYQKVRVIPRLNGQSMRHMKAINELKKERNAVP